MPSIAETAYPRLKSQVTSRELQEVYTPTPQELDLAHRYTRGAVAQLGFLVLLKTFQRLGYFVLVKSVPAPIIKHIAQSAQLALSPQVLVSYDTSGTRWRHLSLIRNYLKIKPYGAAARRVIVQSMAQAAFSKNDLADLINVAIEELVRQQYELPVFNTLARVAKRVRTTVERTFYQEVAACLNVEACARLDSLFELEPLHPKTLWHELKLDPGKPMLKHLQELAWRLQWLDELNVNCPALADIPDVKVKHFAAEAMTLDAARMKSLEPHKRYTLAASFQSFPVNQALRLENGRPIIRRPKPSNNPKGLTQIESLIAERMKPVSLLDVLTDTELWLNWTRFFHPISGHDTKIDNPQARYLAATFCYGCGLGPNQTARSLSDFDPRQVAWVSQRHIMSG